MKAPFVSAAAFVAVAVFAAPLTFGQRLPPAYRDQDERDRHRHEEDFGRGRPADQAQVIRQRADALANEIDNVLDHLEDDLQDRHGGPATRQLFAQADAALREAVRFRDSVGRRQGDAYQQFRTLDEQVHGLMQGIQATNDAGLRRAASRLAFADEQLHAAVATGQPATTEFVARQAHVLAGEAQRLEQSVRSVMAQQDGDDDGRHRGDRQLVDAVHDFVDKVEHFHETAERAPDPHHLAEDFAEVDQSWHRVVDLMNRNPHGAYLYRRAERVGSMHDDLARVIGVHTERRVLRFNLGDLGGVNIPLGR